MVNLTVEVHGNSYKVVENAATEYTLELATFGNT